MPAREQIALIYRELADARHRQGELQLRDRCLVLAADAAFSAGDRGEAERLRFRLLQLNPHHMLKPFTSFAEAVHSNDVQNYIRESRQTCPPEKAADWLESLQDDRSAHRRLPETILPPTRTTINLDGPAEIDDEPVQVYRIRDEAKDAHPTAARQPSPYADSSLESSGRGNARPTSFAARPTVYPFQPELSGGPKTLRLRNDSDSEDGATGGWIASALFALMLLAGAALAGYAVVRPFLPSS